MLKRTRFFKVMYVIKSSTARLPPNIFKGSSYQFSSRMTFDVIGNRDMRMPAIQMNWERLRADTMAYNTSNACYL